MKTLYINGSPNLVKVDDSDYIRCLAFSWYKTKNRNQLYMYQCGVEIPMPNYIMNNFNVIYDHKDRNIFNNQRENLREATRSQNAANISKINNNTYSKYKGVTWSNRDKRWIAQITINGKHIGLGYYKLENHAAGAYNRAALKYFGEFAFINKIVKD